MQRIEINLKPGLADERGKKLVTEIAAAGFPAVTDARVHKVYYLQGKATEEELDTVCQKVLADPASEDYYIEPLSARQPGQNWHSCEVTYKTNVTDPIETLSLRKINALGICAITAVKTATRYEVYGDISKSDFDVICHRLLVNPAAELIVTAPIADYGITPDYVFELKTVDILNAGAEKLDGIAAELGFTHEELEVITGYFRKLGRNPTDAELDTLAQTWSEHCGHKTFKARYDFNGTIIDGLLKSTIMRATEELDKPWCLSVFKDNAGVISFNEDWALAFKVETHNHPSAVEPYGGAATGLGGVVRDILGTGLGAKPLAATDALCTGEPDLSYDKLPEGVLHPRRILNGARSGVADYGSVLEVPTVNGALCFDNRYIANPLVYCGTVGIMPASAAQMGSHKQGDLVVVVGGRTGRDGIRGVTFASAELDLSTGEETGSPVQLGDAYEEKKVVSAVLKARDKKLFSRITDCGGGGFSSAVGEMAEETGVKVYLDKAPLKYPGLNYTEIWISESQERMLLAVPPQHIEELKEICRAEGTEATVIGEFTSDRFLTLYYEGNEVCRLDMEFLHHGQPRLEIKATYTPKEVPNPVFNHSSELGASLKKVLASWNACSRGSTIRMFDGETQAVNILRAKEGLDRFGPQNAAVLKPLAGSNRGVIISSGINPWYGDIDPYWMAASAIEESLRQIVAVGGNLEQVALLDNFSWGSAKRPESLGALVRACQACYDLAMAYGTPFISGKDSLNNEYIYEERVISIPHTLLISAIAVVDDVTKAVTQNFKKAGSFIYIIGETLDEMGGSEYFRMLGLEGGRVPRVDVLKSTDIMHRLSTATGLRLVESCHDLSDGGLATALAEMTFGGELGVQIDLSMVPGAKDAGSDAVVLFSQSNSRFLCEVESTNREEFEKILHGTPFALIGRVTEAPLFKVTGINGSTVINESVGALKEAWQKPLDW
jgi:phosphoribosylformylglycinamidine synthase II